MTSLAADLLASVREIASEAGAATLEFYHQAHVETHLKADNSPVTAADLAAHRIIRDRLKALDPALPILSEEEVGAFTAPNHGRYWLVDPIDGTREFLNHNDEYTINIALIEDGVPTLGVIDVPALKMAYSGVQGNGACRYTETQLEAIHTNPAHWNSDAATRVLVSRMHRDSDTDQWLQRIPNMEPVTVGSSLKFCRIAEGLADLYPRLKSLSLWDIAAGDAILRAAGGWTLTPEGTPVSYAHPENTHAPHFIAGSSPAPQQLLAD